MDSLNPWYWKKRAETAEAKLLAAKEAADLFGDWADSNAEYPEVDWNRGLLSAYRTCQQYIYSVLDIEDER